MATEPRSRDRRYRPHGKGSYTEQAVSIFFDSSFSNSELDTDEANVLLYDSVILWSIHCSLLHRL